MATVNLKDLSPVIFLNNMMLGANETASEKLVVKEGYIQVEHDNTGQGIKLKSNVSGGNKSAIYWYNSDNAQKWRLINDESANKTDDLRVVSSSATALTIKQDGKISIGTSSTDGSASLTVNAASASDTLISFREGDSDRWRVGSGSGNNFVIRRTQGTTKDVVSINEDTDADILFDGNLGIGLPSASDILAQRASVPVSNTSQLLTVKGEARFYQDDPYDTGKTRGIILSWDMTDNTGVIDTTDSTTKLEFDIGGVTKYILEDAGDAGKSAGTEGWIQVNLGTAASPKRGYIRVYTAK